MALQNDIVVVNGKDTTTLVKKDDKWSLDPAAPIDEAKAKALAGGVDSLVGSSFLTDKTVDAGLAKPRATVTATPKSGPAQVVKVGGVTKDGQDYYVQKDGSKDVLLVKKFAIDRLLKKPADLAPSPKPAGNPRAPRPGMMPPGMMPPGMPH